MTLRNETEIAGWHAHIYYKDAEERGHAAVLRKAIEARFEMRMGRWRDDPVGPHPRPMFQVAFEPEVFAAIVPWLALNRGPLAILIHPETGDSVPDHAEHALWLGEKLPLDIDFLRNFDSA
ncbi:MAG: DOPA 4,5-dioxygenase family protein [Rhodospirillaceae bacterium]|jgi:aromatic ring-cleaving dioxygenase|nr:DOPA 4,5-dioxygenase family protein [Rhodospirillaceae bacterium]